MKGDILVDVGAFLGDSIENYVKTYSGNYRKIYAYEISLNSYNELHRNVAKWKLHDVELRRRGAGAVRGEMFLDASAADASTSQLRREGSTQECVTVL